MKIRARFIFQHVSCSITYQDAESFLGVAEVGKSNKVTF